MKLVETPVNSNLNLEYFYPNITKYIFEKRAIKYYKLYSLDRTQIVYADIFDKIILIMINTKKKISKHEVDFAIRRLLHATRDEVTVKVGIKNEMLQKGFTFSKPNKDIIVIEQDLTKSI